ncbi:MAG: VCBS repeat-containing protein [Saprospiraceae bacterium]|nr:VCBS repeat-containing protein [Saprospiraceae bacterium]
MALLQFPIVTEYSGVLESYYVQIAFKRCLTHSADASKSGYILLIQSLCYLKSMLAFSIVMVIILSTISCTETPRNQAAPSQSSKELRFEHQVIDSLTVRDPWAKMFADVNSDGAVDIIVGGRNGPLVWYRNPDWTSFEISPGGYDTVDGESGDVDGDGDMDVVMGGLYWYENPGGLTDSPKQPWEAHLIANHPTHDVELADINTDGTLDVITRNQSEFGTKKGNTIHCWMNLGGDRWEEKILNCDHGEGLRVGDLDGDNEIDIVGTGFWFENMPDEDWARHTITKWHSSANLALGDFNGDQKMDVVLTPSELAGQFYKLSWFEQPDQIRGKWKEHVLVDSIECVIHGVQVADFNLDGVIDIAYSEMHQGEGLDEVVVMINQQEGRNWQKTVLSSKGSHSIEVVDINADGLPDVFGANWSGDYQPIEVWLSALIDPVQ